MTSPSAWVERYFSQTRSPFAELVRHFFQGLLRPESIAGEDSFITWLVQALAILITASWYIPIRLFGRYMAVHAAGDARNFRLTYSSDCLTAMAIMTLLVGLVTVLEWSALFPSRRDHLVLTPLPLTRIELFGAKLAALFLFMTLVIAASAVLTGITIPAVASGPLEPRPLWLRSVALLAGAILCCYCIFLGIVAAQGVLLVLLPVRWFEAVGFAVQMALLLVLLCAFPLIPYFPARRLLAASSWWLDWLPPAWFWGLSEWITGIRIQPVPALAGRAAVSLMLSLAIAGAAYLVSYLQYGRHALEAPRLRRAGRLGVAGLASRCFRNPQARATAEFMLLTLARGRRQKLVFLLVLGLGIALVLESSVYLRLHGGRPDVVHAAVIAFPLTLSFFSLVGLRRVFRVPADLAANWLFRFAEDSSVRYIQLDAVFRLFLCCGGVPILLLWAPVQFAVFGGKAAWVLIAQGLLLWALAEHLLNTWPFIPFTFAPNPARRHITQSAAIHALQFSVYSVIASNFIAAGLRDTTLLVKFLVCVAGVSIWLHRRRRREWGETPLLFTEGVPAQVEPLTLNS